MLEPFGKSNFMTRINKLLCFHDWDIKSWSYVLVYPKLPGALVISTCQKCGKIRLLEPSNNNTRKEENHCGQVRSSAAKTSSETLTGNIKEEKE